MDDLNNWYTVAAADGSGKGRMIRTEAGLRYPVQGLEDLHQGCCPPIIPFTTEDIYQNLRTSDMEQSVHLCMYPDYDEQERDLALESQMSLAQKAIAMGRSLRASNNLKIRQPLKTVFLVDREKMSGRFCFRCRILSQKSSMSRKCT
jgi:isoleucyl-tRNA synthetase